LADLGSKLAEEIYTFLMELELFSSVRKLAMFFFAYIPVPLIFTSDENKFFPEFFTIEEIYSRKVYDEVFFPQKDWIIVDVGANFGIYALRASKMVGKNGLVIAIEPEPLNFKILKQHARINRITNIRLINSAIGDRVGTVNLYLNGNASHSIKQPGYDGKYAKVPIVTLDHVIKLLKINHVDLLKIDAEGAELDVLIGLNKLQPKRIVMEYHGQENAQKVSILLKSLGYKVGIQKNGQTGDLGILYGFRD